MSPHPPTRAKYLKGGKPSAMKVAKKALKLAKLGNSAVYHSRQNVSTLMNAGSLVPTLVYMNPDIVAAFGEGQVALKILNIAFSIHMTVDVTQATPTSVRCDIILDRSPNGVVPTFTEIYGTATPTMVQQINTLNEERFKMVRSYQDIFYGPAHVALIRKHDNIRSGLIVKSDQQNGDFSATGINTNGYYVIYWATNDATFPSINFFYDVSSRLIR